jgi:hypothetical protein
MSSHESSSFATDANGERYFVDVNGRDVYHRRVSGYHNVGGKRVPGTERSIARLGEPNPNLVIPIEKAKELMAMTDEMLEAIKKKCKGRRGARRQKPKNANPPMPARERRKKTDAERVAAEIARLRLGNDQGVIKATRTRRAAAFRG